MKKRIETAFNTEIYLLGKDRDGIMYWLEAPSWNCGWYWGCGYVVTYTNNRNPQLARDINSHRHFNGMFLNTSSYCFSVFKNFFAETTLTDREIWQLLELMQTIYTLKAAAEVLGRGGSNYTMNICSGIIKNEYEVTRINEKVLPALFTAVKNLLSE